MFLLLVISLFFLGICLWTLFIEKRTYRLDIKNHLHLKITELQLLYNHCNVQYLKYVKLCEEGQEPDLRAAKSARDAYKDALDSIEPFLEEAKADREKYIQKLKSGLSFIE